MGAISEIDKNGGRLIANELKKDWQSDLKSGTKNVYLQFYKRVTSVLEEVLALQDYEEEEGK